MNEIKHGGPAFPVECNWVDGEPHGMQTGNTTGWHEGMTLLDFFAGQELAKTHGVSVCDVPEAYYRLADHCYRMADAMLRRRGEQ